MASITIRNLEDDLKRRLRIRAAEHGRSMEEEAREILRHVVTEPATPRNLAASIRARMAPLGGVELDLPAREARMIVLDTNVLSELLRPTPAPQVEAQLAARRAAGRPISQFDCQIAAIGRAHGASVTTRNTADYEGCGIALIDPWDKAGTR